MRWCPYNTLPLISGVICIHMANEGKISWEGDYDRNL